MNKNYIVLGNHPIGKYLNIPFENYEQAKNTIKELQESGYETELYYQENENSEIIYVE